LKRFVIVGNAAFTGIFWLSQGCKKDKITGSIPVITLINDTTIAGIEYPYNDAGAKPYDNEDGDITSIIVSSNNVDTTLLVTYHVFYNVTENDRNKALQVTRTVKVIYTK